MTEPCAVLEGPLSVNLDGWRHYFYVNRAGKIYGNALGRPIDALREFVGKPILIYKAGQWEEGFTDAGKVVIKPEIVSRIVGTKQSEFSMGDRDLIQ